MLVVNQKSSAPRLIVAGLVGCGVVLSSFGASSNRVYAQTDGSGDTSASAANSTPVTPPSSAPASATSSRWQSAWNAIKSGAEAIVDCAPAKAACTAFRSAPNWWTGAACAGGALKCGYDIYETGKNAYDAAKPQPSPAGTQPPSGTGAEGPPPADTSKSDDTTPQDTEQLTFDENAQPDSPPDDPAPSEPDDETAQTADTLPAGQSASPSNPDPQPAAAPPSPMPGPAPSGPSGGGYSGPSAAPRGGMPAQPPVPFGPAYPTAPPAQPFPPATSPSGQPGGVQRLGEYSPFAGGPNWGKTYPLNPQATSSTTSTDYITGSKPTPGAAAKPYSVNGIDMNTGKPYSIGFATQADAQNYANGLQTSLQSVAARLKDSALPTPPYLNAAINGVAVGTNSGSSGSPASPAAAAPGLPATSSPASTGVSSPNSLPQAINAAGPRNNVSSPSTTALQQRMLNNMSATRSQTGLTNSTASTAKGSASAPIQPNLAAPSASSLTVTPMTSPKPTASPTAAKAANATTNGNATVGNHSATATSPGRQPVASNMAAKPSNQPAANRANVAPSHPTQSKTAAAPANRPAGSKPAAPSHAAAMPARPGPASSRPASAVQRAAPRAAAPAVRQPAARPRPAAPVQRAARPMYHPPVYHPPVRSVHR